MYAINGFQHISFQQSGAMTSYCVCQIISDILSGRKTLLLWSEWWHILGNGLCSKGFFRLPKISRLWKELKWVEVVSSAGTLQVFYRDGPVAVKYVLRRQDVWRSWQCILHALVVSLPTTAAWDLASRRHTATLTDFNQCASMTDLAHIPWAPMPYSGCPNEQ